MKNKSYKIPFGVLTAVFGFSYLMYALTFFNFFVQDFFDFMPAFDPLQWLYDYTGTFLWCFMCVLIVAVITAVFYHKYLANKTSMLIYLGAVAAGTLLPLALLGLFVVEWFEITAGIFFLVYGISTVKKMVQEAKTLDVNKVIDDEILCEENRAKGIRYGLKISNYCVMIFAFAVSNMYWIAHYGLLFVSSLKSIKLGLDNVYCFHYSDFIDELFVEEGSALFIFISSIALIAVSAVAICFYRKYLSKTTMIMVGLGFAVHLALYISVFLVLKDASVIGTVVFFIRTVLAAAYGIIGTVFMIKDFKRIY